MVKRFGKVGALAGLDLVACSGEVTAVLGPNGAGKRTFVRAVATLIRPDAGSLRVAGDPALAGLGHTTTYWALLSLAWAAKITLVFAPLAAALYRRSS